MPTTVNFTIEDVSPLIHYDLHWRAGNKEDDDKASLYSSNSTFTLSNESGATATFVFNGSSILIAGAKRFNHGTYSVILDGEVTNADGYGADQFQVPLFERLNLAETAPHVLTITNMAQDGDANRHLDIDFIQWSATVNGDGTRTIVEDSSPQFTYDPPTAWSTDVSSYPGFSSNAGHVTSQRGANATLWFEGDVIDLIGSVGPKHGVITVSLDGGPSQDLNLERSNYQAPTVLYHASHLGSGNHTLVVGPATTGTNGVFALDHARIYSYDGSATGGGGGLGTGAIAGIAVGVVALFAIGAILGFLLWRRRRKPRAQTRPDFTVDGFPTWADGSTTVSYSQSPPPPSSSDANFSSWRMEHDGIDASPPNRMLFMRSTKSSGSGSASRNSSTQLPTSSSTPFPSTSTANVIPQGEIGGFQRQPVSSNSYSSRQERMYIPGREQDAGPAPESTALLPPAYEQATEGLYPRQ